MFSISLTSDISWVTTFRRVFFLLLCMMLLVIFYHKCVEKNRGDGRMKELRRDKEETKSRWGKKGKYGSVSMHISGSWALAIMKRVLTEGEKLDLWINLVAAEFWIKTVKIYLNG